MVAETDTGRLAGELEQVSGKALGWIKNILSLPIDTECGPLLRAQSSAAMTALNTQIRADSLRLRAARQDKALEALIAEIRAQEGRLPKNESRPIASGLLGSL